MWACSAAAGGSLLCPLGHAFCGSHRLHRQTFVPGKGPRLLRVTSLASANVRARQRLRRQRRHTLCGSRRLHEQAPAPGKSRALCRVTPFARASACARQKSRPRCALGLKQASTKQWVARAQMPLRHGTCKAWNPQSKARARQGSRLAAVHTACSSWPLQRQSPCPASRAPIRKSRPLLVTGLAKAGLMPGKSHASAGWSALSAKKQPTPAQGAASDEFRSDPFSAAP